jgi:hypothetical protein
MAERTESSISIDAPPAEVMAVIADFPAYPEWTGAVKEVEIRSSAAGGRAKQVWFNLDAGAIKDQYTLALHLEGRQGGPLDPGRGRADPQGHGRRLPARRRR